MSKADTLGPAPTFSAVRSARRDLIRKVGGEDTAETLTELPVTVISENPDNPRNHLRNLDETVESVREVGIILPIVVATVDAYLRDRTDRADDLDDGAQYVVIDGHRRLEASRRVGLATIPVRVDNARVATDETLLEAAFVANYHRDDMTDLEEAYALQALVDHYGSQTKASKRLGIPQGTISTKLSLLKLTPELQKDLVTGARKVEHVRNLGKLSAQEQVEKADERAAASRQKTQNRPPTPDSAPPPPASGPAEYHGVIIPEPAPAPPSAPVAQSASPAAPPAAEESVPAPRPQQPASVQQEEGQGQPRKLPYDDAPYVMRHLHLKMDAATFAQGFRLMGGMLHHDQPEVFREMLEHFNRWLSSAD